MGLFLTGQVRGWPMLEHTLHLSAAGEPGDVWSRCRVNFAPAPVPPSWQSPPGYFFVAHVANAKAHGLRAHFLSDVALAENDRHQHRAAQRAARCAFGQSGCRAKQFSSATGCLTLL